MTNTPRSAVDSLMLNETFVAQLSDLTWTSDRNEDTEATALDGGESFQDLRTSIAGNAKARKTSYGNNEAVSVYTIKDDPNLYVAAGRRRCNASKAEGLKEVLAIYRGDMTPKEALLLGTVENVTRKGLSYIEKVKRIGCLATDYKMTKDQINARTGIPVKTLGNLIRIAGKFAPESFDFAEKNKVGSDVILAASAKDGADKQIAFMQEALDRLAGKKAEPKEPKEPKAEGEKAQAEPKDGKSDDDKAALENRINMSLARLPLGKAHDRVLAKVMTMLREDTADLLDILADAMGNGTTVPSVPAPRKTEESPEPAAAPAN